MRQTRLHMGMPITVEVVDAGVSEAVFDRVYAFFQYVDETFSPFKATSEVSRINQGSLDPYEASSDMQLILQLADQTKQETKGYFDVWHDGIFNPSGLVKGWAIYEAAQILAKEGFRNYYVDAGGDIQVAGVNRQGDPWRVGIRNPFDLEKIVKVLVLNKGGVATSGFYERGAHIYNPHNQQDQLDQIVSLTVVGPTVYDADRFATAAFAMGAEGISFINRLPNFEGYMIDRNGQATFTSGFQNYLP